jgi:mannose-1-phosphate guanylyltransferase
VRPEDHRWVVVLGDMAGMSRSRQSAGGPPRLRHALARGLKLSPHERVGVVVSGEARGLSWLRHPELPSDNLFVQPRNCGSAISALLAVVKILNRDPFAHILFLPADPHVDDDALESDALRRALEHTKSNALDVVLVGARADLADRDSSYILPGARTPDGTWKVRELIDKPTTQLARELCRRGAYRNTLVSCGWGYALLALLREHLPNVVEAVCTAVARDETLPGSPSALADVYACLPRVDFTRTVLHRSLLSLRIVPAIQASLREGPTEERWPKSSSLLA